MRIAVVKPDWNIRGGFERVVERIIEHLERRGHRIDLLQFDARREDHRPFGHRISAESWTAIHPFGPYLNHLETVRALRVCRADVVISTQPPTFAVEHPRHLSLFYHHLRVCYDLGDHAVRGGFIDARIHAEISRAVRAIDQSALDGVSHILAGSEAVADRLALYNGRRTGVSLLHAGPMVERQLSDTGSAEPSFVLCVSRHSFPKRPELFVHAAHLAPELDAVCVGSGERHGYLKELDLRFAREGAPPEILDTELWLRNEPWRDPAAVPDAATNVRLAGNVTDEELDRLYRCAFCVVVPALLEDYGLTVVEAMRYGKPVIVCRDGGYVCHLVEHGVTGLVVEPTGAAIAAAMRHLAANPEIASALGRQGQLATAAFTWQRALAEFDHGLEQVVA